MALDKTVISTAVALFAVITMIVSATALSSAIAPYGGAFSIDNHSTVELLILFAVAKLLVFVSSFIARLLVSSSILRLLVFALSSIARLQTKPFAVFRIITSTAASAEVAIVSLPRYLC